MANRSNNSGQPLEKKNTVSLLEHLTCDMQELEEEIRVMNDSEYKWRVNWANILQNLLEDNQDRKSEDDRVTLREWQDELDELR